MARPRRLDDTTLLQSAMRIFWQRGFACTGIRELEQGLGLKAPALYHRFGSKEALFQAALDHYIDHVVTRRILHYLQTSEAPLTGLRAFFDSTYDYINPQHPPLACLLVNTSLEALSSDPVIAQRLQQGALRVRNAFAECLCNAQRLGQLDTQADVHTLANVLHLGLQGLLVSSKVVRDPVHLQRQVDQLFSVLPYTAARWQPFAPATPTPETPDESPAHTR
jgi:TetR/AcrR family transcriptional repressor of nem operon